MIIHVYVLYFCRCFSHQSCRFVFGFLQLGWFGCAQRQGVCEETGHLCRFGILPPGRHGEDFGCVDLETPKKMEFNLVI